MPDIAERAIVLSRRVNWLVERLCVALMVLLLLDVWLGVLVVFDPESYAEIIGRSAEEVAA
jgi:hypothetical protein